MTDLAAITLASDDAFGDDSAASQLATVSGSAATPSGPPPSGSQP